MARIQTAHILDNNGSRPGNYRTFINVRPSLPTQKNVIGEITLPHTSPEKKQKAPTCDYFISS